MAKRNLRWKYSVFDVHFCPRPMDEAVVGVRDVNTLDLDKNAHLLILNR